MNLAWLHLLLASSLAPLPETSEAPVAQFVRIELHGEGSILSLAEVEVFSGKANVATEGVATQSTTYQGAGAARAIDAILDGSHPAGSVSHTDSQNPDGSPLFEAWWEVDLMTPHPIEQITIWNRTDCCQERLKNYALVLLDADRKEVKRLEPNPRSTETTSSAGKSRVEAKPPLPSLTNYRSR